jgi:hypothetical protein
MPRGGRINVAVKFDGNQWSVKGTSLDYHVVPERTDPAWLKPTEWKFVPWIDRITTDSLDDLRQKIPAMCLAAFQRSDLERPEKRNEKPLTWDVWLTQEIDLLAISELEGKIIDDNTAQFLGNVTWPPKAAKR